jgi:predicted neuraminidase
MCRLEDQLMHLKPVLCGVLAFVLAALGASAADTDEAAKEEKVTGPEAFEEAVKAAGGAVDFVFGDEVPYEQCHASCVVQAPNGDVLATWFAGTEEGEDDVGIWFARRTADGWSEASRVAKVDNTPHWNPVLFVDAEDDLHLFFKIGEKIPFWQTYWMSSDDNGKTWNEPKELVEDDKGGRGPVRSRPIILSDGAWLAPASTEYKGWKPFVDRSEDQGKTWERSEDFAIDRDEFKGLGAIQPTLWESKPGHVHALLRTTSGRMGRVDSTDGGKTWSAMYDAGLPNNNSGIDALLLESGRLLLVYNPVGENWGGRSPIDLAYSDDNGKTWETIAHLEDEPEKEFSYPSICHTEDGVAITYTWKRKTLRFWHVPLKLVDKP